MSQVVALGAEREPVGRRILDLVVPRLGAVQGGLPLLLRRHRLVLGAGDRLGEQMPNPLLGDGDALVVQDQDLGDLPLLRRRDGHLVLEMGPERAPRSSSET